MYRPNFCAECGARIERVRWRLWTSRRFCPTCGKRFRKRRILQPLVPAIGLLACGFMLGRSGGKSPPPLVVERGTIATASATAGGAGRQGSDTAARSPDGPPKPETRYGPDGTNTERPTDPEETVSICGARTKKGTPCQRRVRGTGRCWQHRGKSAMLPPAKLIVPG